MIEPKGQGFGQWGYNRIANLLQTMPDRYRWNASSLTPYFTYTVRHSLDFFCVELVMLYLVSHLSETAVQISNIGQYYGFV